MDYNKHYQLLISRGQNRTLECYTETHHILPRCMGGMDDAANLVELTPEEHFVAHQLLAKMYPHVPGLIFACLFLTAGHRTRNNKMYGWLRRKAAQKAREYNYTPNHKGRKKSEAWHKAIQERWEQKRKDGTARTGISPPNKGKPSPRRGIPRPKEVMDRCLATRKQRYEDGTNAKRVPWNKGLKYKRNNQTNAT